MLTCRILYSIRHTYNNNVHMKIRNVNCIPVLNHPPLSHSFIPHEFPLPIRFSLIRTIAQSFWLLSIWRFWTKKHSFISLLSRFTLFYSVILFKIQRSAYEIDFELRIYVAFLTSMPLCNPLPTTYYFLPIYFYVHWKLRVRELYA